MRYPRVTAVVGVLDKGEHLTQWACSVGWDQAQQIKREAAARGASVHEYVQMYLQGGVDPEVQPELQGYYESFKKAVTELFPSYDGERHLETKVVSTKFGYAGQIDTAIKINGRWVLIDWKTSGAIYPEYALQTIAYVVAWNESRPKDERISERWVVRLSEDGTWEKNHKYFKSYERWQDPLDFAGFLAALDAFRWKHREQFYVGGD